MSILSKFFNAFIKLFGHKRNLINILLIQTIIVIAIILLAVGYFWLYNEYATYKRISDRIHRNHIETHKDLVKNETLKAVDYIYFKIQETESKQKERLRSRVNMAYSIAESIYNKNKNTRSISQIKQMIKDALRPIRFDN